MAGNAVWCNMFVFTILNVVIKTGITVNGNNDGFLQANNDVQYISLHKEFSSGSRIRMPVPTLVEDSSEFLKFIPPLLDFKERHLGIPHHERVTLFNIDSNKTIHMSSISGSTVHFHSSFFDDKIVPPLGNTTFNVVFLGREEGAIESSLFIHTSEGSFRYQVRGASVGSPYRLRPLVGVRLPLNSTYSPLIHIYNPSSVPLQVLEAYSSGGEFHLELPGGGADGPPHLWHIPPFHTKPVIKIRFLAHAHKNHTAYVRLRVNQREEALVVPLEVQVGPRPGLYSHTDLLDFGLGGSCDQPRQLRLLLYNSATKPVRIQSIVAKPASKALRIDFQPIKVPPDSRVPTRVAVLTFDWSAGAGAGMVVGRILVRGKQGQHKLVLPYVARPLHGCLMYNASLAHFCWEHGRASRSFSVTNTFHHPLAMLNVSLHRDAQPYFQVEQFVPRVLAPGESVELFKLSLGRAVSAADLKLETSLWLHTNVSRVFVPLLCYNGRLDLVRGARLDVGLVGTGRSTLRYIAAVNRNPVGVRLLDWGSNASWASVRLLGAARGNASLVLDLHAFHNLTNITVLAPGHYVVLAMSVLAPQQEGPLSALVHLTTQFEHLEVVVNIQVARGALFILPDPTRLTDCFPGKLCTTRLEVRSHFSRAMTVRNVESVPPDPRLRFVPGDAASIAPLATTVLGHLLFDASTSHSYLGIHHNSSGSWQWLQTLVLPLHTADLDVGLFSSLQRQFQRSPRLLQLSLQLDTSAVRQHLFQAEVQLTWPLLANWSLNGGGGTVQLPLTQVGNTSQAALTVHNPSARLVVAQLVLQAAYPRTDHALPSLASWATAGGCEGDCSGERFKWASGDGGAVASKRAQDLLGVVTHRDALTLVLRPDETASATLTFSPHVPGHHSAVLFIRNNLTVVEVLKVAGQAAVPLFKFGNRKPVSGTPLLFELADKHLKDCAGEKNNLNPTPNLTVKRSFTARNYGELPIYVSGFSVNGLACEGYGFKILNCEAFLLKPNETRKVEIAFTPDFTLARVQRTLCVETSVGTAVNYSLVATLPPALLSACAGALARPAWEPLLYYSVVSLVTFLLCCVLATAYLEADRIIKGALVVARPTHTLDLSRLARSEVRPNKPAPRASLSPLLPARSRKKPTRRGGDATEEVPMMKKGWGNMFAANGKGRGSDSSLFPGPTQPPPAKKGKEPLETKCSRTFKKNKTTCDALVCSEEETSSTTTESSNNDDVDKERSDQLSDRSVKQSPRKTKAKDKSADYKDNYEGDCDDDDYEREVTRRRDLNLRWKAGFKVASVSAAVPKPVAPEPRPLHCEHRSSGLELPYKLKSARNATRDRKDKTVLKRRSIDKVATSKNSGVVGAETRGAVQTRPASCWTEMKASFSDVVARNDSASYSSVVAPRTSPLTNTPECSPASPLGPIGSKLASSSGQWESFLEPVPQPHFLQQEPTSSLFLSSFPQREEPRAADKERLWEEPVSTTECSRKPDETTQANLFTGSWPASLWDPLCTPAVADASLFPGDSPSSVWSGCVDPVWSSNPWSLASTSTAATSTTTAASTRDHHDTIDPALGFSPFHSNNIWLPHSTDAAWSSPSKD